MSVTTAVETLATAAVQGVCVFLVLLFLVFCCIPWLHQPIRQLVRPWVVFHVEGGLAWVAAAQRHRRPWLTNLFERSSHSVSVGFYGSFLPSLLWLGLPELGFHLVMLMTLTLYVGNAMKDLVSAPRPLGLQYGGARLKLLGKASKEASLNAQEYGLPSSHTMNSLCLNFYAVHYLHEHDLLSGSTAVVAYAMVLAWVAWIAASRLYLGLHTPIDILAGAVAGLTVVTCFIGLEAYMDAWVHSPRLAVPLAAALSLVLLRLHPRPLTPTPSFDFTTSFMGVMLGAVAGASRNWAFFLPPVQLKAVWSHSLLWTFRRLVAGFALVVLSKEVFRAIAHALLPTFYRWFPLRLRRMWQPPVHNLCSLDKIKDPALRLLPHGSGGRPCDVETTGRFFAYAGIGFAACELAPKLFMHLGW